MISGFIILIFTSPFDFLLWLFGSEKYHWPDLNKISKGSWYHKAKGYWAESFRSDGEAWSKFCRFVIWWETALILWIGLN